MIRQDYSARWSRADQRRRLRAGPAAGAIVWWVVIGCCAQVAAFRALGFL